MSLVSRIVSKFNNRRKNDCPVVDDRRDSISKRLNAASDRVDSAIDDLCQTVTIKREDFEKMIK